MNKEIFEIYDGNNHLGTLEIAGNRYRLTFLQELKYSPFPFALQNTDWVKPIPYFEKVLATNNGMPDSPVYKDPDSSIALYLVEDE